MPNPRREFLTELFRILDQKEVPYCVLRNYQDLYDDTNSDVDLVVEPERVPEFDQCLGEAAAASGHRLVLRARYVNFSYVYWHAEGGFLRIDLETESRWRVFPVLTAKSIVGLRRKQGPFYIPHPRHESVVLFLAAIWRRNLSDRYRQQLNRLYEQLAGTPQLQRTFRAAFGTVGEALVECQKTVLESAPQGRLWRDARRSLMRNALRDGPSRRACLAYLIRDVRRLGARWREPAGISLLLASSARPVPKLDDLFREIQFLYPSEKTRVHSIQLERGQTVSARPNPRLGLACLYTLFKGGLFARVYGVAENSDLARVARARSRSFYPSRAFLCVENSRHETILIHEQTGFMAEFGPADADGSPSARIIRFMSDILGRRRLGASRSEGKPRGVWAVLVGLDGSGKTTVARKLCCLGPEQDHFRRIRYSHWQPRLFGNPGLPLPDFKLAPRKPELARSALRSALSAARLFKNLVLANLAHLLRVRSWLRRNSLVLVDRYFYNYFLDPVSVKYYGPAWLLEIARRLFPQPDLVVVLKVPAPVVLARKQELSREQALEQTVALDKLRFHARQVLELDGTQTPTELARAILAKAAEMR